MSGTEQAAPAPLNFGGVPVPPAGDDSWRLEVSASNDLRVHVWKCDGLTLWKWIASIELASLGGGGNVQFQAMFGESPQAALDAARDRYTLAMLYIATRIRAGGALARAVAALDGDCEPLPFEPRDPDTSPPDASHFRNHEERA